MSGKASCLTHTWGAFGDALLSGSVAGAVVCSPVWSRLAGGRWRLQRHLCVPRLFLTPDFSFLLSSFLVGCPVCMLPPPGSGPVGSIFMLALRCAPQPQDLLERRFTHLWLPSFYCGAVFSAAAARGGPLDCPLWGVGGLYPTGLEQKLVLGRPCAPSPLQPTPSPCSPGTSGHCTDSSLKPTLSLPAKRHICLFWSFGLGWGQA